MTFDVLVQETREADVCQKPGVVLASRLKSSHAHDLPSLGAYEREATRIARARS